MKLLGSTKQNGDQGKEGQDVPKLESVEVFLVHCNSINNKYQQAYKAWFTFVPNKQFGQLITIAPHSLTMMNTKKCRIFIHRSMAYWSKYQATWNQR